MHLQKRWKSSVGRPFWLYSVFNMGTPDRSDTQISEPDPALSPDFGHEYLELGLTPKAEYFLGHLFSMKGVKEIASSRLPDKFHWYRCHMWLYCIHCSHKPWLCTFRLTVYRYLVYSSSTMLVYRTEQHQGVQLPLKLCTLPLYSTCSLLSGLPAALHNDPPKL